MAMEDARGESQRCQAEPSRSEHSSHHPTQLGSTGIAGGLCGGDRKVTKRRAANLLTSQAEATATRMTANVTDTTVVTHY